MAAAMEIKQMLTAYVWGLYNGKEANYPGTSEAN
jgi:hypothetical protein